MILQTGASGRQVRPIRVEWFLPCAVQSTVRLAAVALLANLVLNKLGRIAKGRAGLGSVELRPLTTSIKASWCSTCLLATGRLRGDSWMSLLLPHVQRVRLQWLVQFGAASAVAYGPFGGIQMTSPTLKAY